jgi:cytochrome c
MPTVAQEKGAPYDLKGHGGPVRALAISPDGAEALSGSFDYAMIHWRLGPEPILVERYFDHEAAVNAVAFVPKKRLAVTASDDGTVGVFDLEAKRLVTRLAGHTLKVVAVAVSPDGRWAASASWDRTARLWNLETLESGPVMTGHHNNVNGIAFSADGSKVFTAGYDGTIRQWRRQDGAEEIVLYRHGWGVNAIRLLPDGRSLLFGGLDGTVGVLDLATGAVTKEIAKRDRPILSLAVSDGHGLASVGSGDGAVEVFGTSDWQRINLFENPYGPVWALAFTGDGDGIYFAGLDDEAHYWRFRPQREFEPAIGDVPRRFQVTEGLDLGERQFARKCSVCHTLTRDGGNRAGPTLYRLFGRRAGTSPGYSYSEALKGSEIVWTEETVSRLFADGPEHFVPGSKMPLQRMSDPGEREALIAYLKRATTAAD